MELICPDISLTYRSNYKEAKNDFQMPHGDPLLFWIQKSLFLEWLLNKSKEIMPTIFSISQRRDKLMDFPEQV